MPLRSFHRPEDDHGPPFPLVEDGIDDDDRVDEEFLIPPAAMGGMVCHEEKAGRRLQYVCPRARAPVCVCVCVGINLGFFPRSCDSHLPCVCLFGYIPLRLCASRVWRAGFSSTL